MSAYRHTRQVRLAEVGEEGQVRLARATVTVRGLAASGAIEARYLAGAGIGALRVREIAHAEAARAIDAAVRIEDAAAVGAPDPCASSPIEALGLDPAAYDVARGAWCALDAMRQVLGGAEGRA